MPPNNIELQTISLKQLKDVDERWVHQVIKNKPSLLGLGDVFIRDAERIQSSGGRLDLLLQDEDDDLSARYAVEIQLGATDESHIIRTLEYWDLERKRTPGFDHTAVIVAEEITGRFFNVISLFNGHIPIIAIKMTAIRQPDGIGLLFHKIFESVTPGAVEEEEEAKEITDRTYWEVEKGSPDTVKLADQILEYIRGFAADAELSYNKYYIGLWLGGRAANFARFKVQRSKVVLHIKLPLTEERDRLLGESGITILSYDRRNSEYRLSLTRADVTSHKDLLIDLLKEAHKERFA